MAKIGENPGLGEAIRFEGECTNTPAISSTVTIWDGLPRVDIRNTLTRKAERAKEAAYFAFPFAASEPEVRLEIPNGVMRPEIDQLPGACKDWYALQHFARVSGRQGSGYPRVHL
jgi:alpha-mannosidase